MLGLGSRVSLHFDITLVDVPFLFLVPPIHGLNSTFLCLGLFYFPFLWFFDFVLWFYLLFFVLFFFFSFLPISSPSSLFHSWTSLGKTKASTSSLSSANALNPDLTPTTGVPTVKDLAYQQLKQQVYTSLAAHEAPAAQSSSGGLGIGLGLGGLVAAAQTVPTRTQAQIQRTELVMTPATLSASLPDQNPFSQTHAVQRMVDTTSLSSLSATGISASAGSGLGYYHNQTETSQLFAQDLGRATLMQMSELSRKAAGVPLPTSFSQQQEQSSNWDARGRSLGRLGGFGEERERHQERQRQPASSMQMDVDAEMDTRGQSEAHQSHRRRQSDGVRFLSEDRMRVGAAGGEDDGDKSPEEYVMPTRQNVVDQPPQQPSPSPSAQQPSGNNPLATMFNFGSAWSLSRRRV
jgi:hypothetical protein